MNNSDLTLKAKAILVAALLIATLGAGYVLGKRSFTAPTVTEKIVYQDKIVTREVLVTKDVVRTETRPDGTKIVTVSKTDTSEHVAESVKTKESDKVTVGSFLPKNTFGLSIRPETFLPFTAVYTAEYGRRIGETPIFVTASVNTKREVSIGLSLEF